MSRELSADMVRDAASSGDHDLLKQLLSSGLPANKKDRMRREPLHYAASAGHVECVKVLLRNGVEVNACTWDGKTALHLVCSTESSRSSTSRFQTVKALVEGGADVNIASQNQSTPLHEAIACNNTQIVKLLLESGAQVEGRTASDLTPLMVASMGGSRESVRLLLSHNADANAGCKKKPGTLAIHYATEYGHAEVLRPLLESTRKETIEAFGQKDVSLGNTSNPLLLAVRNGHLECLKILLEFGLDPNRCYQLIIGTRRIGSSQGLFYYSTILGYAVDERRKNRLEALEILLQAGAKVNVSEDDLEAPLSALAYSSGIYLSQSEVDQIFNMFLERGVNVDYRSGDVECPNAISHAALWSPSFLPSLLAHSRFTATDILYMWTSFLQACFHEIVHMHSINVKKIQLSTLIMTTLSGSEISFKMIERCLLPYEKKYQDCQDLMKEIYDVLVQPRSLQHLCRDRVRTCLKHSCENITVLAAVNQLKIPKELHLYLLYQDRNIEKMLARFVP